MKFLRALSMALSSAIVSGGLTLLVSLWLTELYRVSDFDDQRGMLIGTASVAKSRRIAVRYRVQPNG